jgi:hypothetical protein
MRSASSSADFCEVEPTFGAVRFRTACFPPQSLLQRRETAGDLGYVVKPMSFKAPAPNAERLQNVARALKGADWV